ncbi:unnamed protein product, partial [Ectocarpus sp. 12 AP-2014]
HCKWYGIQNASYSFVISIVLESRDILGSSDKKWLEFHVRKDVVLHDVAYVLTSAQFRLIHFPHITAPRSLCQDKEETVKTNYSLADTVFAKAELKCDGRVCIWLGASVMVEYTYKEA